MCLRSGDEQPDQNVIKEYKTLGANFKNRLSDAEQQLRAKTASVSVLGVKVEVARASRNVSAATRC